MWKYLSIKVERLDNGIIVEKANTRTYFKNLADYFEQMEVEPASLFILTIETLEKEA